MDTVIKFSSSQPFPPTSSPGSSLFGPRLHSSDASFPIIAIAIIGILATAFLLVSYYIFVIKCCLNWHRIDLLHRFSSSRNRNPEDPLMAYSPARDSRGLDESVIRSIPIFKFKKQGGSGNKDLGERTFCECAVCLNEFQEDEKLRIIPNCSHVFHIDCIDVWLQNNASCPLCRTSISTLTRFHVDHIAAPSSSPPDPNPYTESVISVDEDYVVIELGNHRSTDPTLVSAQERLNSGDLSALSVSPSPRKLEQKKGKKKVNHKVISMGDECIDIRGKDEQFAIQPIRRSFSMDSSVDQQLYLLVQEIVQQRQSRQVTETNSPVEGCSSRSRRAFFSFRGSRSAVLPVYLEP